MRLCYAHRNSISDDNPYREIDDGFGDGDGNNVGFSGGNNVGDRGKDAMHCVSTIPNAIPFAMTVPIVKSMVVLVMEVL